MILLYRRSKKYSHELFIRALMLEWNFIHIYQSVPREIQQDIDAVLNKIKPL